MTPKKAILIIVGILLLIYVGWPLMKWKVRRVTNYTLDYKSQVEDTVKDMVKPECLIDPKK